MDTTIENIISIKMLVKSRTKILIVNSFFTITKQLFSKQMLTEIQLQHIS